MTSGPASYFSNGKKLGLSTQTMLKVLNSSTWSIEDMMRAFAGTHKGIIEYHFMIALLDVFLQRRRDQ
jgi:hypothetical protein